MKNLKGKVIWVTGASSGIGEALARQLAEMKTRLVISARSEDKLREMKAELEEKWSTEICVVPVDVTKPEELKEAYGKLKEEFGVPDIVIANAGTHLFSRPLEFDASEYNFIMNLNFGGMLNTFEVVASDMLKRKSGHLVGMASLAGYRGLPRAAAYGASKSAMIHFLESLYFHYKRQGIVVSTVNPGFVKTPLTDKNDFNMPFLVSSTEAARTIIKGIRQEKRKIAFPFLFSSLLEILRILPFPLYQFIVDYLIWPEGDEQQPESEDAE